MDRWLKGSKYNRPLPRRRFLTVDELRVVHRRVLKELNGYNSDTHCWYYSILKGRVYPELGMYHMYYSFRKQIRHYGRGFHEWPVESEVSYLPPKKGHYTRQFCDVRYRISNVRIQTILDCEFYWCLSVLRALYNKAEHVYSLLLSLVDDDAVRAICQNTLNRIVMMFKQMYRIQVVMENENSLVTKKMRAELFYLLIGIIHVRLRRPKMFVMRIVEYLV